MVRKKGISERAFRVAGALTGLMAAWSPLAYGAEPIASGTSDGPGAIEEIVVTAEKRSESLQTVPMAITAFTNKTLVASGITDFRDYAVQVPNLSFAYAGSIASQSQSIAIRGIYGQNTTGMYLDDTPLPETVDPRVLDIDQIEVLKGPQGTLYGARSMGGTIRLVTNQPESDDVQGYVHATGSGTTHGGANDSVDAAINLPVIKDTLAVRLSGYDDHLSGFYDRFATPGAPVDYGEQKGINASSHNGGSISASLTLLDNALTITPRVIVQHMTEDGHTYADYTAGNLTQYRLFNLDEPGSDQWNLYSLTVKYKTPIGTITSDSSEFIRKSADSEDDSEVVALFFGTPGAPVLFHQTSRDQNFSQELRFASEFSGPLQVTGGAFYQDSGELLGTPVTPDAPYISDIFSSRTDTQITETALFGEATYSITSQLKAIAGIRWFNNNVKFNGNEEGLAVNPASFSDTQHQAGFNPKYGLEYRVNDDDMVYVTAAKGFRTGGVNAYSNTLCAADLAALGLTNATAQSFVSDSVWSYELGIKTSWLDNRLRIDAAVFDIEWTHVQQLVDLPTCGFGITVNGGAARSQGAEMELQAAVTEALRLSMGAGYVDAKIVNSGALNILPDGSPIQQVPKWTYNATADYRFNVSELPAFARIEYAHVGSSISENNSIADPLFRPAYSLTKVRSGVDVKQWEITAFADNVFNAHANLADAQPQAIVLPGRPRFVTNRPRTIGLDFRFKF